MSNIQDGLDYEANQRRTNRRPDKPVEFDHWDVLYWLPRAYQTGVLSDTEYTRYLEIMRSYKYLPSTPGSYHSVLYFSATEDPMLTVRATVSNTPSLDHFLCRYFTPDGRREAIEAAILPSGRTGIIEISRLLYGDLSALRAVGSMRRLMGGISKLKGLAGSHTGLTVFAEVHEKLRKRLGFDKTLPLNNGTTLSLQVGPD